MDEDVGGKLSFAPIEVEKVRRAMDVGTGTGIWAIEFADQHPSCHVIGTDLSPIQPTWVPPNCEFLVDNADLSEDAEWGFPPVDFIHSRLLVAGFQNWVPYIRRGFSTLNPGGWIELLEVEFPLKCPDGTASAEDDPLMEWGELVTRAGDKLGCDFQVQNKFVRYLEEAGFTNIHRFDFQWPIGPWPEDEDFANLGADVMKNANELLNSSKAFFTRALEWKTEDFETLLAKCRASMMDPRKHRYFPMTLHYAQKPVGKT
ncbi:putative methyltransferase type 12 [Phaeomoniella chlamydospora]|uniref:Putative methyltransferase type 12 n=1 Tax=Phaeomoniella chlamydospora TaxID=158046 RepID=A0A0G2F2X3_PHACM|nr:putative methyltransferase type 12 [Phaeomoniella chlamydospora]